MDVGSKSGLNSPAIDLTSSSGPSVIGRLVLSGNSDRPQLIAVKEWSSQNP